jgi:hypothetical protein
MAGRTFSDGIRQAGLAVRWRDLPFVSYVWTMSNGALARRLGRYGWLLLPISGPVHLLAAALARRSLVRKGRAVARVTVAGRPERFDVGAVLLVALPLCLVAWLPVLVAPFLLPARVARYAVWVPPAVFAIVVPDLVVAPLWAGLQRLRRQVPPVPDGGSSVAVAGLAAYPRGAGHGARLLTAVHRICDDRRVEAFLDLRTASLARWYERFGYRTVGYRRMCRPPRV